MHWEYAGAGAIHVNVRNSVDESTSTDLELFREVWEGLRSPMRPIVQISTGGRPEMPHEQRNRRQDLRPEMASLTTGSVNCSDPVYVNEPETIRSLAADMHGLGIKLEMEIFDTGQRP